MKNLIKCNKYDKCVKICQMWLHVAKKAKYDKGDKDDKSHKDYKGPLGDKGDKSDKFLLRRQSVTMVRKCEIGKKVWQIWQSVKNMTKVN